MLRDPSSQMIAMVRSTPGLFIVDKNAEVIARTGGPDRRIGSDPPDLSATLRRLVAQLRCGEPMANERLADGRCLRGFPLLGLMGSFAVFIERARTPMKLPDLVARYGFTIREAEIIVLLVRGATNHEISDHLQIGETTVVSHIRNAGQKLGCTKRASIVARVLGFDDCDG